MADDAPKAEDTINARLQDIQQKNRRRTLHRISESKRNLGQKHDAIDVREALKTAITPDLFAYALIGPWERKAAYLQAVFANRGIARRDSAKNILRQLSSDVSNAIKQLRLGPDLQRIRFWTSSLHLHRVISILSSSNEGCELLAQHEEDIVEGIRSCRKAQYPKKQPFPCTEVLKLLNNLTLNMRSKGIEIGSWLCNAGLYYACKVRSLPAIKLYLELLSGESYHANHFAKMALMHLVKSLIDETDNSSLHGGSYRKEILDLITGWKSPDGPALDEDRGISFATITLQKPIEIDHEDFTDLYFIALGELGLSTILSHEWSHLEDSHRSLYFPENKILHRRVQIIATAFLLAKDSTGALSVIESAMQPPSRVGAMIKGSGRLHKALIWHYWMHGVRCDGKRSLSQLSYQVKTRIPLQGKATIQAIEGFLLQDFFQGGVFTADWVTVDGNERFRVMKHSGLEDVEREEVYFKPVG